MKKTDIEKVNKTKTVKKTRDRDDGKDGENANKESLMENKCDGLYGEYQSKINGTTNFGAKIRKADDTNLLLFLNYCLLFVSMYFFSVFDKLILEGVLQRRWCMCTAT